MPGMTMTEKILAKHAGKARVAARRERLGGCGHPHDPRRLRAGHDRHLPREVRPERQGLGPGPRGHHPRPLHLHRRREVPSQRADPARLREGAGAEVLLRPRFVKNEPGMPNPVQGSDQDELQGRLPQRAAGGRPHPARRDPARHRLPHLHRRRVRPVRHRHRQHRRGFALGTGKTWLKVPPTMKFIFHGADPAVPDGQGSDPRGHRRHRRGRGDLSRDVFRRRRRQLAHARRPHDADQHGHRGRRQERRLRRRREDAAVRPRPLAIVPNWEVFTDDADAQYFFEHECDLATMEPMVAKPHSPGQQGHRPQLPRREARPRLHRLAAPAARSPT